MNQFRACRTGGVLFDDGSQGLGAEKVKRPYLCFEFQRL
jgi:hypothetical protein